MIDHLISFTGILREAGLRISPLDIRTLLSAISLLPLTKRNMLLVLGAVLAKNRADLEIIYRLFDCFINSLPIESPAAFQKIKVKGALSSPPRLPRGEFISRLANIKKSLTEEIEDGFGMGESAACQTGFSGKSGFIGNNARKMLEIISCGTIEEMRNFLRNEIGIAGEKANQINSPEELEQRLKVHLSLAEIIDWLKNRSGDIEPKSHHQTEKRIKIFESLLREEVDRNFLQGRPEKIFDIARRANLEVKDFSLLNPEHAEEVKQKLVRLGRKLATHPGYRRSSASRGAVDLRRTVQKAKSTGGIPLKLFYTKRLPTKPEIVILCDLSGSVAPYCRFMLTLVCAIREKFSLVRVFSFVDEVEEVTRFLSNNDINQAVLRIYRETRIWQTGFSDYGRVWEHFYMNHLEAINKKSTLIILGDARNNYKPEGLDYFRKICSNAGRVIWFNPSPREKWNREDSIIGRYSPFCDYLFECRNLSQLQSAIRTVLRRPPDGR